MPDNLLFTELQKSLSNDAFAQLKLADYRGNEKDLKQYIIKPVLLKGKTKYSCVFRYKTKDITKNFSAEEINERVQKMFGELGFGYALLTTTENIIEAQRLRNGSFKFKKKKASTPIEVDKSHDKKKQRILTEKNQTYLHALGITNNKGEVKTSGQDKFKQIAHYIEIVSSLIKNIDKPTLEIVDMGSGKGYLTFALYDFIVNKLGRKAHITGIEQRPDLVDFCQEVAEKSGFQGLSFQQGTIDSYEPKKEIDILIALHACDTATDDAIYKGIKNNAELIIVAPCCHKQIRREMVANKKDNELDLVIKHGIFLERQAEMLTDAFRAMLMEYCDYKTRIFEFIATAHTPKNVLIVGQKNIKSQSAKDRLLKDIELRKEYFGIQKHYLETLLFKQ